MKTSQFIDAIEKEEREIRRARARLKALEGRAIRELCPVTIGDLIELSVVGPTNGSSVEEMRVTQIFIIPPFEQGPWKFKIFGTVPVSGGGWVNRVTTMDFPED